MPYQNIDWIAVDWGTSNLRAWLIDGAGKTIACRDSSDGMGSLEKSEFEPALLSLIGDVLNPVRRVPIVCCGMVGSRQGWIEAPYQSVPCPPLSIEQAVNVSALGRRLDVMILPGVSQANPADVMRGEETQISGYLSENRDFRGTICLPGTHTKWVRIQNGMIIDFRSFITGELFFALSNYTVLRHGLSDRDWNQSAFLGGVRDAMSHCENLTADLFSIRAAGLIHELSGTEARARLSGLLVGLELAGSQSYWDESELVLIGAPALTHMYETALSELDVSTEIADTETVTLNGLRAAYREFMATT